MFKTAKDRVLFLVCVLLSFLGYGSYFASKLLVDLAITENKAEEVMAALNSTSPNLIDIDAQANYIYSWVLVFLEMSNSGNLNVMLSLFLLVIFLTTIFLPFFVLRKLLGWIGAGK
jgi:hypothetical protein